MATQRQISDFISRTRQVDTAAVKIIVEAAALYEAWTKTDISEVITDEHFVGENEGLTAKQLAQFWELYPKFNELLGQDEVKKIMFELVG